MNNFLYAFRVLFLCYMLVFFSITPLAKLYSFESVETACDGGKFDTKLYNLFMKLKKYKESLNVEKALETMFEIKIAIEDYNNKKIDIDKAFKALEEKMKEHKVKIKKDDFEEIKTHIKKAEIRFKHKLKYMSDCSFYNIPYDSELEYLNFMTAYGDSDESSEEHFIPRKVQVGVPTALAGVFLIFLPCTQQLGIILIISGLGIAADGICEYQDEEDKK